MLEKSIFPIFRSEIPYNELTNVVCSFCSDLLLFASKFKKTVQDCNFAPEKRRNFAPEMRRSKFAFLQLVHLCGKHWQIIKTENQGF